MVLYSLFLQLPLSAAASGDRYRSTFASVCTVASSFAFVLLVLVLASFVGRRLGNDGRTETFTICLTFKISGNIL